VALPADVTESSGVAVSRSRPGVYWTHDDDGPPLLHAVDEDGARLGRVRLDGVRLRDLEDIEIAGCGDDTCLYLGDVGDNGERRDTLAVYRLREPDPARDSVAVAETFRMRLPDGPRDVEALFVLPGERLHLVGKGRNHGVSVYRYPGPLRSDAVPVLEEAQRLSRSPHALPRQVTGASASPDGRVVAIRTYETVTLHAVVGDTLAPLGGGTVHLRTLREAQGEGVGLGPGSLLVLTSEAGPVADRGSMAILRCRVDGL